VKRVLSVVPMPLTAASMAIEMAQAIKAYSIAVAADWSAKKLQNKRRKKAPPGISKTGFSRVSGSKFTRKNSIDLKSCWLTRAPPQSYGLLIALAGAIGFSAALSPPDYGCTLFRRLSRFGASDDTSRCPLTRSSSMTAAPSSTS
jgi:hypothetical protein